MPLLLLLATASLAQQQSSFSLYKFHPLTINPAHSGFELPVSIIFSGRKQWVNLEGAPTTGVFSINGRMANHPRSGLGLSIAFDRIGITNTTSIYGSYSFKVISSKKQIYDNWDFDAVSLSLGLSAGLDYFSENLNDLEINNDPNFTGNLNIISPNFGAGIYYSNNGFFLSFSVPKMITTPFNVPAGMELNYKNHFYLMGGKVLQLNHDVKLKPSFLLKYVNGAPAQADANLNILLKEALELGVGYRSNSAFNAMVMFYSGLRYSIGYNYDNHIVGNLPNSAHEIVIQYRFINSVINRIPRFNPKRDRIR